MIYIYLINLKLIIASLIKIFLKNINITVLKKFPKSLKFDLAIISTNSLERSLILNKLHTYNKIKYFIIEKFLFTKLSHFESSKSFFHKRSNKIFINVWGSYVANLLNIKIKKKKIKSLFEVEVQEGRLLTNLIHYLDMFFYLTEKNIDFDIFLKKKINSKRLKYHEARASIRGMNRFGKIIINSNKKVVNDYVKITNGFDIFKIIIAKKGNCYFYKNSKLIKVIEFPFSFKNTAKIYEQYLLKGKKSMIFKNSLTIFDLSEKILKKLHRINNKIYIT